MQQASREVAVKCPTMQAQPLQSHPAADDTVVVVLLFMVGEFVDEKRRDVLCSYQPKPAMRVVRGNGDPERTNVDDRCRGGSVGRDEGDIFPGDKLSLSSLQLAPPYLPLTPCRLVSITHLVGISLYLKPGTMAT